MKPEEGHEPQRPFWTPRQPTSVTPLFQQIVEALRADLEAGRILPGGRLPSENELARLFRVSRITAKKALDELAYAGLVQRIQGKGTFALALDGPLRERQGNHPLIGFLLPDFSEPYGLELLHAIELHTQEAGAHLIIKRTFDRAEHETRAIQALLRLKVQGLIIFPVHGEHYNPELLKLVLGGFPVVLVDRYLRGIPACSVFTDNRDAAACLTTHVLQKGCRHVAFASPPVEHTSTIEDRLLGLETTLARRGLVPEGRLSLYSSLPHPSEDERRKDEDVVRRFVSEHPELDAVVTSEYSLAVSVTQALNAAGKRVPDDVVVACFDAPDEPFEAPFFTHVQQAETVMGKRAVELIVAQLGGERVPLEHTLPFTLIEGRSTQRQEQQTNLPRNRSVPRGISPA